MADGGELVEVGTQLVYRDESVRVWTLELAPGQEAPMHQHPCDYVYVVVHGGRTEMRLADGTVVPSEDDGGHSVFHTADQPHSLKNVGMTPYKNIIVELVLMTKHD